MMRIVVLPSLAALLLLLAQPAPAQEKDKAPLGDAAKTAQPDKKDTKKETPPPSRKPLSTIDKMKLPGGAVLASSIFPLEHMVRVMARDTDAGLARVIRMASLTPAERTGVARDLGSLEPGKLADIVILSADLFARRTFINGVEFHGTALHLRE